MEKKRPTVATRRQCRHKVLTAPGKTGLAAHLLFRVFALVVVSSLSYSFQCVPLVLPSSLNPLAASVDDDPGCCNTPAAFETLQISLALRGFIVTCRCRRLLPCLRTLLG